MPMIGKLVVTSASAAACFLARFFADFFRVAVALVVMILSSYHI